MTKAVEPLPALRRRLVDTGNLSCALHTRYDACWTVFALTGQALFENAAVAPAVTITGLRATGISGAPRCDELLDWPAQQYCVEEPVMDDEVQTLVAAAQRVLGQ